MLPQEWRDLSRLQSALYRRLVDRNPSAAWEQIPVLLGWDVELRRLPVAQINGHVPVSERRQNWLRFRIESGRIQLTWTTAYATRRKPLGGEPYWSWGGRGRYEDRREYLVGRMRIGLCAWLRQELAGLGVRF